ncbi:WD40-repeat-containing domain protein [Glomus cerebriforme]|uniref:WD40-repeat-containing domain protein n=1 Tax=Glomus cerebriforme TaxID=658196 RepID=A0A397T507_9GLOM|nr:WD40-repeat-containing domain protein [Glomus cerebriforme]
MVIASNVFTAGVKSSQIWKKTEEKKNQTQKEEDDEIEELLEEENEKPEESEECIEDIYGLLLNVINAHRPRKNQDKGTYNRLVAFGCFCFAPASQKSGNGFQSGFHDGPSMLEEAINGTLLMAAADQCGCVISFDFGANKFWQVSRLGIAASTIAFTPLVRSELVVAFTDNSIRCYNIETRQLIAETRCHRNPVNWISMHPKQHMAITSAKSEAILWDMADWSKQKVLNHIKKDIALRRATFSPQGEYIITSFFDDSICIWNNGSFDLLWMLHAPTRISDRLLSFSSAYDNACRIAIMSKNSRVILVAGKKTVFVWDFDTKNLIRDISLKSIIEGEITKLKLIHDDADLLVSSSDGRLLIIDIFQNESQIYHLNVQHPIKFFDVSPDGKFIVTNSTEEKAILKIWDLEVLISDTYQHQYRDFSTSRNKRSSNPAEFRIPSLSNFNLPSLKAVTQQQATPDEEEISDLFLDQEPKVKKDSKMTKEPIKSASVSSVEDTTTPASQEMVSIASITSMESINLQGLSFASREEKRERLIEKLHQLGRYPDKYRIRIWRILLDIPQNQQAYREITSKGVDPAIKASLSKNLKSSDSKQRRIIGLLEQFLSSLVRLGFDQRIITEWIFHMIYPFVELLSDTNEILSFEIILNVLFNWYQHCWDEFPNPSTKIMNVINVLLEHWDNDLHTHLMACNIKIQDCAWTMIQWSFARILTKEDWLELWDHLLSNEEPSFMYFFLIAYIMIARDVLLGMTTKKQVSDFFSRANIVNISISKVLEISYKLEKETPLLISPRFDIGRHKPLLKYGGEYKLDYNASLTYYRNRQDDIRDWILEQEKEIIKKRIVGSGII